MCRQRMRAALAVLVLAAVCVSAEDLIEQWVRAEFVQVPGGVCPEGNWPTTSAACGGSVLYGCLPSWSGVIDFVDGTPTNCTLDSIVVAASGSFGCPAEPYTVTATLNGEVVVGQTLVEPGDHDCGCTAGSEALVVAEFDPAEVEAFQFGVQNIVQLTAEVEDGFCACLTQVVGTFRCDLEQDEHEKYLEQQALEQVYHLTNGDNWYNNSGWLEGSPCTNAWYGISCDDRGHVVGMSLSSNNLNGILPDLTHVGSLIAVEVIENQLFGSLPELPRLVSEIFFSGNHFSGNIPESWNSLEEIEFFNLDENYLTGSISQGLMHGLVDVVQFSVANNFFNGTFPSDLSRNLRLLELTLSFNEFSGPLPREYPSVDSSHLQYISFDNNLFSGPIPVEFNSKVPLLSMFSVQHNELTGPLPEEFASLPRLLRMDIRDNMLSGVLPDAYNDRPDIHIMASGNDWTCPLPDWCEQGISTCGICEWVSGSESFSESPALSPSSSDTAATPSSSSVGPSLSSGSDSPSTHLSTDDTSIFLTTATDEDPNSPDTNASSSPFLNMDDTIVVIVAGVIFSCCGISIVVGVLLFLAKRRRTGELELPAFVDNDE